MAEYWCFCGGVVVVVFLWWCSYGGVLVVVWCCGGVCVVVFLWWWMVFWWCFCGGVVVVFLWWYSGDIFVVVFSNIVQSSTEVMDIVKDCH